MGLSPSDSHAPHVHSIQFHSPPPRAISIPIGRPDVRVRSFAFAAEDEPPGTGPFFGEKTLFADISTAENMDLSPSAARGQEHTPVRPSTAEGLTRIRPPADVIKLEDRLQYILQPSLESLLAERSLAMPFAPFPFQFEGVAFLYPRQAAVLADEMGLGKTMQAITAIRLLLCRGELRSVLLVWARRSAR